MQLNFDVVIIGSGPAGITAAIYLKRANLNVVMIDSNAPGGQLNRISIIENYPGFPKIVGADLAYSMFAHTQDLGVPYKYGKVIDVIDKTEYKIVKTEKEELTCRCIILATGRKPKELGLPNEKGLIGRGISWCAICDGALFKGKDVIVVGGGNSALEESLYLSGIARKVTIVHHSEEFRGDAILQSRVLKESKIDILYNSEVVKLNVINNTLNSVEIKDNILDKTTTITAEGMFIYIGFEPSINYISSLSIEKSNGYIIVDKSMKTSIDGIFACGDMIEKELYQITTAIADGSEAATSAIKFINSKK